MGDGSDASGLIVLVGRKRQKENSCTTKSGGKSDEGGVRCVCRCEQQSRSNTDRVLVATATFSFANEGISEAGICFYDMIGWKRDRDIERSTSQRREGAMSHPVLFRPNRKGRFSSQLPRIHSLVFPIAHAETPKKCPVS
jgi:hypothetical protein